MTKSGKRTFTINKAYHVDGCPTKFSHGDYTGRYVSHTPNAAAMKALTELCHVKKIKGQCTLYIEMRETTQGSKHKIYSYHVKRAKLNKPVEIAGNFLYYQPIARAVDIPTEKCKKTHKSSGPMKRSHTKKSMRHHSMKGGSSKNLTKKA